LPEKIATEVSPVGHSAVMHAIQRVTAGAIVAAACGGQTAGGSDGGATGAAEASAALDSGAHDSMPFFAPLRPDNYLCLPQPLPIDPSGEVRCRIVEMLPTAGDESACLAVPGLSMPDPSVVAEIRAAQSMDATYPICQLTQIPADAWAGASCVGAAQAGWCYVSGPAAGADCAQALRFSATGTPQPGARVLIGCDR
jgi:hypothetical protein